MNREQFLHIIRAAAGVSGVKELTVFGSNAIVPWLQETTIQDSKDLFGDVSETSVELDLTTGNETLDVVIDGAIGELSKFHETQKYHAHGTGIEGFKASPDWQKRARRLRYDTFNDTLEVVVPSPEDLVVSKLAAGRSKDLSFAESVVHIFKMEEDYLKGLVEATATANPEYKDTLAISFGKVVSKLKGIRPYSQFRKEH